MTNPDDLRDLSREELEQLLQAKTQDFDQTLAGLYEMANIPNPNAKSQPHKDETLEAITLPKTRYCGCFSFSKVLTFFIIVLAYALQRSGYLITGASYYLPNGTPDSWSKRTQLFRNCFYTIAKQRGYSRENIRKMVLTPTQQFENASTQATTLEETEQFLHSLSADDLYEEGRALPFVDMKHLQQTLNEDPSQQTNSTKDKATFVLFPGVLAEFVNTDSQFWQEAFDHLKMAGDTDILHTEWQDHFSRAQSEVNLKSNTVDKVFSLETLGHRTMSLKELLAVATLRDQGLQYNLVRFFSPIGSLESLGTLESTSKVYLKRLDKFFKIMSHLEGPVYFVGYSRGANVALHSIAKAKARLDAHPWAKRLKGMVSVSGVLYGTQAADNLYVEGHPTKQAVDLLIDCAQKLDFSREGDFGSVGHALEIARNTKLFLDLGIGLASIPFESDGRLNAEFSSSPNIDPWTLGNIAQRLFLQQFQLHKPVAEYFDNVKTFKVLIEAFEDALMELTTVERKKWWQTHEVPSDVHYYGIVGTLPEALTNDHDNLLEISERDITWDETSLDFRTSPSFFYDLLKDSGSQLNDGQVALPRALFWPNIHQGFNPKQTPIQATTLGVIAGHHWGISLPKVFDEHLNEYPRDVLFRSILMFIENDRQKTNELFDI